ncbi:MULTISPECIES: hypothetical protein [Planktothrix]|jgi:hypothetical protein|uniref:Uncharacterized protein n=3 Tax=Planktothrix agardhii TaxID=1160 RepID=A0A073CDD6_PLAA1|nr:MULTISPECIES: hypothetical protein [Planktothrix]MCF3608149.1 hypothetical protein [Planktothrix agardhii 1033]CAD5915305.1 hypothetical protein NO108_00680 [Planktothrix rubescens]BBD54828.1 hypothetical protein NIES204_21240 [Planktothrix agardhii NIES-204]KEI65912.1 hypothetical protein A19Y_0746 [Planktothrix agardhii NIVA-CYA 126/8]MBG0745571.1 hypothetical protein [Planktothrix agardhii KL2]
MKATVSRLIVLILAIGEVFTSLSAIALAGGPPPGKPTRPQAAPATTQPNSNSNSEKDDLPPRFPLPSARVGAVNGIVTIKLINNSNTPIQYQLIGGTRQELLAKNATIQVQGSPPITLTYQRQDGGSLLVIPKQTSPGVLEVQFEVTNNFSLDTRSMNITEAGSVFLN